MIGYIFYDRNNLTCLPFFWDIEIKARRTQYRLKIRKCVQTFPRVLLLVSFDMYET